MRIKLTTDEELLASLEKAHAEDVLSSAYSNEEVVASIRADGGDPEGIGQRGAGEYRQRQRRKWKNYFLTYVGTAETHNKPSFLFFAGKMRHIVKNKFVTIRLLTGIN